MPGYAEIETMLIKQLGLMRRPVAVSFRQDAPAGVPKFSGTEPSGCSFWRIASDGRTFYTVPSDHYNCPIGSYTHNIELPSDRARELEETLGLMVQIGYLKMEEVTEIPRLPQTSATVTYAPLADSPTPPDVVIVAGPADKIMLLQEAAQRAGRAAQIPLLGRPTCMALPAALAHGATMSTGCIGNRVYTDLGSGELYAMLPGKDLERIAAEVSVVVSANAQLARYHQERRATLATE
jgi:uncharacterized protein (DUF169 family)